MATETKRPIVSFELSPEWRRRILFVYLGLVFLFVLAPVIYVIPAAVEANFSALGEQIYVNGILNSFKLAMIVAVVASILSTIAARFYRKITYKNSYILFMTLPLFVPGDTHAVAVAVFAKQMNISLTFWTLVVGHVMYVFPFGFLMVLATMAGLPQNIIAAAEDLGATEFRAFYDVEFPLVLEGIISAFLVSFLLSVNEAPRASILGGEFETISGIILSYYGAVGITPTLFALNIFLVLFAIGVIVLILIIILLRA